MARCLTVLIALLAQGMALMSPVCFVRCVAADGHQCIELTGQGCHCCDCQSRMDSPELCAVAKCGHHYEGEQPSDHEHDALIGWQAHCEHCSCRHSPVESAPQVQNKSLASDSLIQSLDFMPSSMTRDFVSAFRALENAGLQRSLLRSQESPQLAALATVVLRV